jgi:hypothetical protein
MWQATELVTEPERKAHGANSKSRQDNGYSPRHREAAARHLALDAVCTERPRQLITCRIHDDRNPAPRNEDGSDASPTGRRTLPESGARIMASGGEGSSSRAG